MRCILILPIAATLLISACDSSDSPAAVVPPDLTLEITSTNAVEVASTAYEAATDSQQLSDAGGGFFIGSSSGGVSKLDSGVSILSKAGSGNSGGTVSGVPIPEETIPCAMSGTTTVSGDIADIITPTLSPGDFIQIVFAECDEGLGEVTNGTVRTDIDAFNGDFLSELFSVSMTMTLTNFQVSIFEGQATTPTDVITSNGAVTVTVDAMDLPFVATSLSGDSMTVDSNASSESLTIFRSDHTLDGNSIPAPFTSSSSGTLDSSQLAGVVRYSTPVTFTGLGADYPSSGEFLVEGLDSSLLLVAEDNVNVRIEIDLGADGSIDETINTTWAELAAR